MTLVRLDCVRIFGIVIDEGSVVIEVEVVAVK